MRLIHDWAKMLKIAGQKMGCFRRPGREEDGLIFLRKTKRNWRRSRLHHKNEPCEERVQAGFAIGEFCGDIAPRFLNGVGTCKKVPRTVPKGVEQKRRVAFRIMSGRKQYIGIEEEPVHKGDSRPPRLELCF